MALEIVGEHTQGAGSAADFLQRAIELFNLHTIWLDDAVGAIESAVSALERAARTSHREVKVGDSFAEVVTDLFQGHLVDLLDDVLDAGLDLGELSPNSRQLHRPLRPVHRHGRRAGIKIERHEGGPSQQVTSAE